MSESLIIPMPREQVDIMLRAAMFAQRIINEAMTAPDVPSAVILDVAQDFDLRARRKLTPEERCDPDAIARLLGVNLDEADVVEIAPAFQTLLDSIVPDDVAEAVQ